MTWFFLVYPLLGLCSGFLAGLLGIGGGLVIVPALMFILPYQGLPAEGIAHSAVATSLATVIVTSLVAARTHHRHHAVEWSIVGKMAPGLFGGALIGAVIAVGLPGGVIRVCFGAFALVVAVQMAVGLHPPSRGRLPAVAGLSTASVCFGMLSAVVGVGGGTLIVPFLRWANVLMQRSVATASACGFPIALGGSLGFALAGIPVDHAAPPGATYWPAALWIGAASVLAAPLGAGLTHRVSTALLTRVFAVVLAIIGVRLIWI